MCLCVPIVLFLNRGHFNSKDLLHLSERRGERRRDCITDSHTHTHTCSTNLGREALLHVSLHPPQQEGLQLLVQGGQAVGVPLPIRPVGQLKALPVWKGLGHDEVE